jgi:hypothetical protein
MRVAKTGAFSTATAVRLDQKLPVARGAMGPARLRRRVGEYEVVVLE